MEDETATPLPRVLVVIGCDLLTEIGEEGKGLAEGFDVVVRVCGVAERGVWVVQERRKGDGRFAPGFVGFPVCCLAGAGAVCAYFAACALLEFCGGNCTTVVGRGGVWTSVVLASI